MSTDPRIDYVELPAADIEKARSFDSTVSDWEFFALPEGRRFHFADPNGNELAVWTNR